MGEWLEQLERISDEMMSMWKKTFDYIVQDVSRVMRYLPWGILAGLVVLGLVLLRNKIREKRGKTSVQVLPAVLFYMYLAVVLVITLFSRETGSRDGFDLKLFSTWGINARNNAFVVENVLLFIPYGVFVSWYQWSRKQGSIWRNATTSLLTSVCVECLQLVSGRGIFQVDDILTNFLGGVMGSALCLAALAVLNRRREDRPKE